MNEQNELKSSENVPPVNRAQATVRVILWLLPAGFGVLSAEGITWLTDYGYIQQHGFGIWLLAGAIFNLGAGWYNALLSTTARGEPDGVSSRTILFFFLQLLLMPLLFLILAFLYYIYFTIRYGAP